MSSIFSIASSSLHILNGDVGLSRRQKEWWFRLNRVNNGLPCLSPPAWAERSHFECTPTDLEWQRAGFMSSPSRALSNLFWMRLPWRAMQRELGHLKLVDLGCGTGTYAESLDLWSENRLVGYRGLDVVTFPQWETHANCSMPVEFKVCPATRVVEALNHDVTMLISQSSLEHIVEDVTFFKHVAKYVKRLNRPFLQVHHVPAPACIRLYPLHGIRQYGLRPLARIARLFSGFSTCSLVALGGRHSNALHFDAITDSHFGGGGDQRQKLGSDYVRRLKESLITDMRYPDTDPSFYVLLIQSHFDAAIFHDMQKRKRPECARPVRLPSPVA